ncbi:MAG: cobalamin-independent methionine synthase II family protein [Alphaproteobacteria bacterium]|nr:cobalamin-independent methionine synthase II family protein [Alphaproteobacteria bacterium]
MKKSLTRIRSSHVGRLPPPKGWEDMPARLANSEITDPRIITAQVTPAIEETVKRQVGIGIDCIGDGEFWTSRSLAHYTAHLTGVEARAVAPDEPPTTRHSTRERDEFPDFYADCDRAGTLFLVPGEKPMPPVTVRVIARGPVRSRGPEAINRQLEAFTAAIERSGTAVEEAFVPVLAPGWLDHFIFNEYYKTEEEFLFALADALSVEYRAVVAAGFILQIDDPGLADWWDMLKPEPTVDAYRRFAQRRIDAVNRALAGIPEERVRYHLCWGSWHGPHTHDLPLEHIIDLILEVKARTYSFEAANVRHEHEWRVWQSAKLSPGKMLMPGVVSHATNLVEHPQLVADRIQRYAQIVGRENVIAGTDCGLGGRVHADLVWAKLRTLVEGARLASQSLWS